MSYTKGPWTTDENGWIVANDPVQEREKVFVTDYVGCGSHQAMFEKNADELLTLSAPELYECFKELLFKIDNQGKNEFLESALRKRCIALLESLKEIE